jgi:hypothetical protein
MREGYKICDICGEEAYAQHGHTCAGCKNALDDCGRDAAYLIEKLVNRIVRLEDKVAKARD